VVHSINNFCASGLTAIGQATAAIEAGQAGSALAGGVEMMSRVPFMGDRADYYTDRSFPPARRYIPVGLAADLLAQAEHDSGAQSILITDDADFASAVEQAVERQLAVLPRKDVAEPSWRDFGAVICVSSLDEAPPIIDAIAAEHLELAVADPDALFDRIRNAGAVFLGRYTPEAIGDYVGGSNHVLPTARSARFSSGLSVLDFVKRTSILRCNADNLRQLGPAAMALAEAEGLSAHGRSVGIRLNL